MASLAFSPPRCSPKVSPGRLGRKTGPGWYAYEAGARRGQHPPVDADPPAGGGGFGRVVLVTGELPIAGQLPRPRGSPGSRFGVDRVTRPPG